MEVWMTWVRKIGLACNLDMKFCGWGGRGKTEIGFAPSQKRKSQESLAGCLWFTHKEWMPCYPHVCWPSLLSVCLISDLKEPPCGSIRGQFSFLQPHLACDLSVEAAGAVSQLVPAVIYTVACVLWLMGIGWWERGNGERHQDMTTRCIVGHAAESASGDSRLPAAELLSWKLVPLCRLWHDIPLSGSDRNALIAQVLKIAGKGSEL